MPPPASYQIGDLFVVPFPAAQFGLWTASPPDGRAIVPSNAAQALAAGALAALDGPMFDPCATGSASYATATCERLRYAHRDLASAIDVPSSEPNAGVTIGVTGGRAFATRGAPPLGPDVAVAVQLYPALVMDGMAQTLSTGGSNLERVWRAALGLLPDGRLAFVVGVATLQDFAYQLAALGFVAAGYTDGGGSARVAVAGGAWKGSSENRRVPSWLVVRDAAAGAPGATSGSAGTPGLVVGGIAATITVAMLWWATR